MNKTKPAPKWEQSNLTLEQYQHANRYALKLIMPVTLIISSSVLLFTIGVLAVLALLVK